MHKVDMSEFYDSYEFLEMHPAFIGGIWYGLKSFEMMIMQCCKNGTPQHGPIYVYPEGPRFEEFSNKGYQTSECDGEVICIWVTYKDYYGYSWQYDHVEFDLQGGPSRYVELHEDDWQWQRMGDSSLDSKGYTYEETVINLAKKVKDKYGDYSRSECDDNTIVPKWIVENNKIHRPFGEKFEDMFKDGQFNRNPKNIHLDPEQINEIWWQLGLAKSGLKDCARLDVSKLLKGE